MMRFLALSLVAGTAVAMDASKAATLLNSLWTQTDTDPADGKLSFAEFQDTANALGLDTAILTAHNYNLQTFFDDLDADADGFLTTAELVDGSLAYTEYYTPFMNLFTNNAGSVPEGLTAPPDPTQFMADASVTLKFTVNVPANAIYQGQRKAIADAACTAAGQPLTACKTKVVPAGGFTVGDISVGKRRMLEIHGHVEGRKLQLPSFTDASKSDITTIVYFPDADIAEANVAALPATAADMETTLQGIKGMQSVTVSGFTQGAIVAEWEPPFQFAGIIGGALLAAGLLTCLIASICSGQVTKAKQQEPAGCCATGCCSFNAVKSWAFGEFTACILIAGAVFYLYDNMQGLTDIVVGLLELIIPALTVCNPPAYTDVGCMQQIEDIANLLPDFIVVTLQEQLGQFKLLPFAVMGPGVCCILFLFLASVCPCHPRKGTYCCTKIMVLFANIFLLVAFIFYLLFASISVGIKYAPPVIQTEIRGVTGMCDNLASSLGELLGDNAMALATLQQMGQNVTSEAALLTQVATLTTVVEQGCVYVNGVFTEFENLFLPGLACVCAVCYAMFVNNTLCCAAGCCCKAPKSDATSAASTDHVKV